MKRILCLWLPQWPIQRLRVLRPELDRQPLALFTTAARGKKVVAFCSPEAAQCGIAPGMPLAEATTKVEVIVSGGVIYPRLGVLVGPLAVEAFSKIHADVAVMSAGGITAEGITNSHGLLIEIQRAMIEAAGKVILCVDHTKFGRQSISALCGLDRIDVIVTDKGAPADLVKALRKRGLEVIVAPNG